MVAYSFKRQFIEPIQSGAKQQTIRADRKRHANAGEALQLYSGMRTRQCVLIGRATCLSIQPIRIEVENAVVGFQSGRTLTMIDELDDFARMDGFDRWATMRAFWSDNHSDVPIFSGVLIRWCGFVVASRAGILQRGP
jgi:hypothetical protein